MEMKETNRETGKKKNDTEAMKIFIPEKNEQLE